MYLAVHAPFHAVDFFWLAIDNSVLLEVFNVQHAPVAPCGYSVVHIRPITPKHVDAQYRLVGHTGRARGMLAYEHITMDRYSFNIIVEGEIVESDLIEATPEEWKDAPESMTGAWSVLFDSDNSRILANRLVGVPVRKLLGTAAPSIRL